MLDLWVCRIIYQNVDEFIIYRLDMIETDFKLGKTTLIEHFCRCQAVQSTRWINFRITWLYYTVRK